MAILTRPRFLPQQRLDLEGINTLLSALRTDSKLYTKQLIAGNNLIYKGFVVSGLGLKSATVTMADSTLIIPQNTNDFSWYTAAPGEANIIIPDADLTDGVRNYVEISLANENNTPLTAAFWDPEANSGLGSEFNQIVETVTDLKVDMVVSTGGFSGLPDRLPLCIIDTDVSGNIKTILDRRTLFGRLGTPSSIDNSYSWSSKVEPSYAMTLTGVVGTFVAGETLTINTETAKCTTGGTSSIAFNLPTGINFFPGSTVTGALSGATGTVNTISEAFTGADKNLKTQKDINDALATELKLVKGTRFWYENPSSSIVGIVKFLESVLVQATATAAWSWDGTNLKITDDNVSPANDTLGYIRMMGRSGDLALTREDGTGGTSPIAIADGEVLFVKVPATGSRTYSGSGSSSTNFQVTSISTYASGDDTYWLAYREGNRLYIRGYGEMEPGEVINIGDPELEDILATIAANLASSNQDRTLKLIEGGVWSVNNAGDALTFTADAYIHIPGLSHTRNTISAQTISMPNATSVAYVSILRTAGIASVRSVTVADEASITLGNNDVIIARRTGDGIVVGSSSFLLKANEALENDGAVAEINRRLTQLKLHKHETANNKARILGADFTQLDSDILSQVVGEFILKFTGAVINFTTGAVLKEDDSTALGINFTPFAVPVGQYYWYGISLIPGNVLADNRQEAQVQIDFGDSANAVQATAPMPVITGDIKLGAIQVFNNAGTIEIVQTRRLGVGSGSGSGSGDANSLDTILRDRFAVNSFEFLEENIFRTSKATKVLTVADTYNATPSTGSYSPAKRAFSWTGVGQTLISTQSLDDAFLAEGIDLSEVELYFHYLAGFSDPAAVYQVSRDGGLNYQTMTMEAAGLNAFRGYLQFTDELSNQSLVTVAATGAGQALNATTQQQLSSKLILSATSVVKTIDLNMNYGGVGTGLVTLRLVKDSAGSPSTAVADIISESDAKTISTASLGGTGNITVTFNIPDVTLVAGTYHLVLVTDAAYKAGTLDLSWRSGAGTNGATFDGTVWTPAVSSKAFLASGRALDLRVKVTSSVATSYAEGYGLYYGLQNGVTSTTGVKHFQKIYFSGDENRTDFTLTFTPDPELLTIHDPLRGQIYVIEEGVARIEGQVVKFEPNTFNFPGESIVLQFRQTAGSVIDNSDSNAAAISSIQSNLLDIGEDLSSQDLDFVIMPKIAVPNTTIVNRAMIPDLTQDLKPRFAIDRIQTQQLVQLQDEFGPNGEPVFGIVNDKLGQIRLVGTWDALLNVNGIFVRGNSIGDFCEISFVGTGLNILLLVNTGADYRASVDGGAEGPNIMQSFNNVLAGRNTSANTVVPVVNNLAFGLHTVKIRQAVVGTFNFNINGFEVLNENASGLIQLPPGSQYVKGKKRTKATLSTTSYNSGFETGTLGTKGGRVLVYQKADGTIAKAVTPTDATQLNLTSASHANEEPVRRYHFREFGAGRFSTADDFSLLVNSSNRAFTLDDGTTTLTGSAAVVSGVTGESVRASGAGNFIMFTFVGTGLDILTNPNDANNRVTAILVDGISIGSISTPLNEPSKIYKIVSGLPYGTHTVKFLQSTLDTIFIQSFIVYQPKTPSLPSGAAALSSYNIVAAFDATNISGTAVTDNADMYNGVIAKSMTREIVYVGAGWTLPAITSNHANLPGGFYANTATNADYLEYTFFGIGVALHFIDSAGGTSTFTASIDGVATAGATNKLSITDNGAGSYTINTTTGFLPARMTFTGLTLGKHTIRLTKTAGAGNFAPAGIYVITPIHSFKDNGPFVLQNTLPIGSQGLSDLRKFSKNDVIRKSNISQALGVTNNPSTTSTTFVPMPDTSTIIKTTGGDLQIIANASVFGSVSTSGYIIVFVNGTAVGTLSQGLVGTAADTNLTNCITVPVMPGYHKVDAYWQTGAGTLTCEAQRRVLTVREVKESN